MEWWMIAGVASVFGMAAAFVALNAATKSPKLRAATNHAGWKIECPKCNTVSAAADAGMIRIGAASKGKRSLLRCPSCQRTAMMRVFRDGNTH